MQNILERLRGQNPAILYLGLGGASVLLLIAAIIGAMQTGGDEVTTTLDPGAAVAPGAEGGETPGEVVSEAAPEAAKTGGATAKGTVARTGIASKDLISEVGATRVGVTPTSIRWGLHAPETFDGVPLNLAEDPLLGVDVYLKHINQSKVNGRTVEKIFGDDRYTVAGAKSASDKILTDGKVFFVSGTLGVDQVATVAAAARATVPPTPYMAAGGSEADFKSIGMYQIAGSYDTHLVMLAQFLGKEVKKAPCPNPASCTAAQSIYGGLSRIAAVELDSKYIQGSVESLRKAVLANGMQWAGKVTVPKYTDSSNTKNYTAQILALQQMGAQIVIPATDPLTTSAMMQQGGQQFKWSASNFAHDSDVALKLMGGYWTGVRALSGGCYYQEWNSPMTQQGRCGQLKAAHDAWIQERGTDDWNSNGQGGVAGYQLTHFWLKALKDAGDDLTRERFVAALAVYNGYTDLVTGPISFLNSPNIAHGIDQMAVYEATTNQVWRQISDGVVGSF